MLGANERKEQSVRHMFVSSWLLSTAHHNFYLLCFHLGSRRQRLSRFILTVKNFLSLLLIKPHEKSFPCMCMLIHKGAHTHIYECMKLSFSGAQSTKQS